MKKLLSLMMCLMVFSCCFVGCYFYDCYYYDYYYDLFNHEWYYGVIQFSKDSNQLVFYNPKFGEVEIPESENECTAYFYGYEEDERIRPYQLKVGDFVDIYFEWEKNEIDNSIKILDTNPAKFDKKAYRISAYKENIFFEKTDYGYAHSFPLTDEIETAEVGDTLYFLEYGGENGRGYIRSLIDGEIIAKTNDTVTVALIFDGDASWFFDKYISLKIETTDH